MDRKDLLKAYENAIASLHAVSEKIQNTGYTEELEEAASRAVKAIAVITVEIHDDLLVGYKAFTLGDRLPAPVAALTRGSLLGRLEQPAPFEVLEALVDLGFVARTNTASMAPSTETTQ